MLLVGKELFGPLIGDLHLLEKDAHLLQLEPAAENLRILPMLLLELGQDPRRVVIQLLIEEEVDLIEIAHRRPHEAVADFEQLLGHLFHYGRRSGRRSWRHFRQCLGHTLERFIGLSAKSVEF